MGDPLPNEIQASVLDPVTNEKSVTKVLVSYPVRPLFCTGCKSLGHSTSACPKVNRVWVQKVKPPEMVDSATCSPPAEKKASNDHNQSAAVVQTPSANQEANAWVEVKRKKSGSVSDCEASPSPPVTFRNLKKVDEVDAKKELQGSKEEKNSVPASSGAKETPVRLTKSQKKKLKASRGSSSPSLS